MLNNKILIKKCSNFAKTFHSVIVWLHCTETSENGISKYDPPLSSRIIVKLDVLQTLCCETLSSVYNDSETQFWVVSYYFSLFMVCSLLYTSRSIVQTVNRSLKNYIQKESLVCNLVINWCRTKVTQIVDAELSNFFNSHRSFLKLHLLHYERFEF